MSSLFRWDPCRARYVVRRIDVRGVDAPLASATKTGVSLRDELDFSVWNPDSNISNYKLVEPNDFVVGLRSFQHGISHSNVRGIVSPAYHVLRCGDGFEPRFYKYYFRSEPLISQLANITQGIRQGQAIDMDAFVDLDLPVPPLEEQRRIADFLDAETARIDQLTAFRAGQSDAFETRELSRIMSAFEGPPGTQLRRPTPWRWLASIPGEWPIGPVNAYFSTDLGKMLNPGRSAGGNQAPYLRNANVHWYEIDTDDMATMAFEPSELQRYSVRPGDLLVCEGGAGVAEAAVWDGRIERCYFQKSLHRVRQVRDVPVEWLMYWLRLCKHVGQFDAEGNLSTIPHLTGEQLRALRLPIPPDPNMQVSFLNDEVRDLGVIRAKLRRADGLLAERRRALITAAVTGQFEVTTGRGADLS
jgi:type I restriction enzyme S subunit